MNNSSGRQIGAFLLFAVAVLLLLPDLIWLCVADGKYFEHSVPYALMSGLLPSLVLLATLFAILGRRPWLSVLLMLPFLLFVPIETAYVGHYGEPSWYAIIATILESNTHEVVEFLGSEIWPLLAACVACLGFGLATIVYLRRVQFSWTGRLRNLTLTAGATAVLIGAGLLWPRPDGGKQSAPSAAAATAEPALPSWAGKIEPSFPFGVPLRYWHYRVEWNAMRTASDRLHTFRFKAHTTRAVSARQIYVLVIGETGRKDRWQLYGYERATNPELAGISNLIRFEDMVTPAGESRDSVPIIASRKRANDHRAYFDERSISAAFSEAGFATFWLSNQMAIGHYDSPIAVVAFDAEHVAFYSVADWGKAGTYDEVLLEPLKEAIASSNDNLFVVLHTMGSHANYAHRYPPAFDVFKPSLKGNEDADYYDVSVQEQLRNSYDNSILYTDHFIAAVIRTLAATGDVATMWYISDHGEDFASATCKLAGHGNGTEFDFRIPSVFWYSDGYAQQFPEEIARVRQRSRMKLTTENVFESLIDMAALDFPGHDPQWSIFSSVWQAHPRIVNGLVPLDIDAASAPGKCHVLVPSGQ